MSAKQGGSFATLLLSVPLAAIPLMAIFGIPEFAHVSASTEDQGADIVRQPTSPIVDGGPASQSASNGYRNRASDLFVPADQHQPATTVGNDVPQGGAEADGSRAARPRPLNGFRSVTPNSESIRPSPRPMQTAAIQPMTPAATANVPPAQPSHTGTGLTWREASRKLEEIGITDYRLERGHNTSQFLFVCLFTPGNNSRIVQRFEAEASEPLEAVEAVLAQVDEWLQHRYIESRSWVR